MDGWLNVDADPNAKADVHSDALEFVRHNAAEIDEVYLGHVIEHLFPSQAKALLSLLCSRLRAGAVVSVVVPDIEAIFEAYRDGVISNHELNERYVYSYVQPSHHLWCYDEASLIELMKETGFTDVEALDPLTWPPVYWKEGPESRWQCGVKATSTGVGILDGEEGPEGNTASPVGPGIDPVSATDGGVAPITVEAMLLERVGRLRHELDREVRRRSELEASARDLDDVTRLAHSSLGGDSVVPTDISLVGGLKQVAKAMMPVGSRQRRIAGAARESVREIRDARQRIITLWTRRELIRALPVSYRAWSKGHDATAQNIGNQVLEWRRRRDPRRVTAVIVDRGDEKALTRSMRSLVAQSWGSWEAVVLFSAGESSHVSKTGADRRIRFVGVNEADPWSHLDAVVAPVPPRNFLVFMEAGDELAHDCFFQIACHDRQDPAVDLVHWDDDVIDAGGARTDPRFRPEWSPETLLSANYLGRSFAIRQARYVLAGGIRPELEGARLWDLLLRSQVQSGRVSRITRVLGHLHERNEDTGEQGVRAVMDHLVGRGAAATVESTPQGARVHWDLTDAPQVSVVIPTRHNRPLIGPCLESLRRTDYSRFEVVVVDNGSQTAENEEWYEQFADLDLTVQWWTEPFNYSAVNNHGARQAKGDVLVFLNDDTEILDGSWMRELVGWAGQPEIGVVGLQLLDRDGNLQHAGAVLGMNGFADHVFQGLAPESETMLGSTTWYRDVLAVTGACLAIRRDLYDEVEGFDERFVLCGSDVALGLDTHLKGKRNLCSPFAPVRHLESVTRGTHVPRADFFSSYWRYQHWIFGGDPYFSPNLSLSSRTPQLRSSYDPSPADRLTDALGRRFEVFRQRSDQSEAFMLADTCRATSSNVKATVALHKANSEPFPVRTLDWFLPDIDSPFYGGVNTAFRIADRLARDHDVQNRFVVIGGGPEEFFRSAVSAAFPRLANCPTVISDGSFRSVEALPLSDAAIATLWTTAYAVAHAPNVRRKFYLIQDFEPMFYPAGSLYALAEESYRLGLYGLTNTPNLLKIYQDDYAGQGMSFTPAVDPAVFHARGRSLPVPDAPATIFVYARPGHWRNCWELAGPALEEVKERLGDRVRIVTAGSWAVPDWHGLPSMRHLGLLDYRATGDLYRECDIGLSLTVSKHPSYLPLELMACGVPVVAFDNPWGHWALQDGHNSLLTMRTVNGLADALERMVVDVDLRQRLGANGVSDIQARHSSWEPALAGIYDFLCDPEGQSAQG